MLWKERYVPIRLPRTAVKLATLLFAVVLFGPLIEPAAAAFREWWSNCWNGVSPLWGHDWARGVLNESLRQLDAGIYFVGIIAVAAIAATSIAGERERGTWTSVVMTLVTGREVTRAKVSGTLWAMRGLSIPFLISWIIGLSTGAVHPLGVLAAAASLIIFARYAAALGVLISMLSSSSERAIAAALMALVASNFFALLFIPLNLIGPLAGTSQTLYLAAVTPLVEWLSLASPMEFLYWWAGQPWETRVGLPWGFWNARILVGPGLIRTYVVSLALHAIATAALMRMAAWLFDSQRDGPRWRSIFRSDARQMSAGTE